VVQGEDDFMRDEHEHNVRLIKVGKVVSSADPIEPFKTEEAVRHDHISRTIARVK
jgi:hypothetical protein